MKILCVIIQKGEVGAKAKEGFIAPSPDPGKRSFSILEKQHLFESASICKNNLISFHIAGAKGKRGLSQVAEDNLTPPVP